MPNTLIQFRMDEVSRQKATLVCEQLGFDLPTYLRLCIARLNRENGIPFSMKLTKDAAGDALAAMKQASRIAGTNDIANTSLQEINAEIAEVRANIRRK